MDKLNELRKELDLIDREVLSLIGNRIRIAKKIGEIKKETKIAITDKKREKEIINNLTRMAKKYKIEKQLIKKIWKIFFKLSYKAEEEKNG